MPIKEDSDNVAKCGSRWLANKDVNVAKFVSNGGEDVDELMASLTSKLCLKQNSKPCKKNHRPSPYSTHHSPSYLGANKQFLPECVCLNCRYVAKGGKHGNQHNQKTQVGNSYDLLQELLREGRVIKEAVKRLQSKSEQIYAFDDDTDSDTGYPIYSENNEDKC